MTPASSPLMKPEPAINPGRLLVAVAGFLLVFSLICFRLITLHPEFRSASADAPVQEQPVAGLPDQETRAFGGPVVFKPVGTRRRADILDRNGLLVATDLKKPSLCANGNLINSPETVALELTGILPDLDMETLFQRLKSKKSCIFIKRAITRKQQYEINRLGIVGLDFQEEDWRVYPHRNLTAHTVGFASPDNIGLAGIEQSLNTHLTEIDEPLNLSIDLRTQGIMREELARVMKLHDAKAASGVLLDVNTAEVVSMVSLPDFDPNNPGAAKAGQRFNRASHGVYELGSVLKIFTVAMGLESGQINLNDTWDVSRPLPVKGTRFTIKDFHPRNESMDAQAILRHSSNIGAAKIAQTVGQEVQERFLRDLGLLTPLNIELPEVGKPVYPSVWRDVNTLTISYGHGVSFSPLQLTSSTAALVNGGIYRAPTFLKRSGDNNVDGKRVLSAKTSKRMRDLMRNVVEEGTGRRAQPNGFSLGGKTGTAEKPARSGYSDSLQLTSFLGAFPISNPRYVLLIVVDEPKPNQEISEYATAGIVAAPVVKRFIERAAPLLGIQPDMPQEPDVNAL